MGWWNPWSRKSAGVTLTIDQLINRLEAAYQTGSGVAITPDLAMQSPTVRAIVTAVANRIAISPVHVFRKTTKNGRTSKEPLPDHPVEKLLQYPNSWQTRTSYWLDAVSWLVRYGNYYAFKARGLTGPIRRLEPLHPGSVSVEQDENLNVTYRVMREKTGGQQIYQPGQIHHVRMAARNGLTGDSPIMDVREAIALEIAAEKMGAAVFGNDARPGLIFEFADTSLGFKTEEERAKFVEDFQKAYGGNKRLRSMLMPKGIKLGQQVTVENEKAQFLETRKYQRTVIAGAFNVPPHLVGDLERGTFNNVEQQSLDFVQNVVQPYVLMFESAMERDLLTDEDWRSGVIIRFNLDGSLRGDVAARTAFYKTLREVGAMNANEIREHEGMNPRTDPGGSEFWDEGPSGQGQNNPKQGGQEAETDGTEKEPDET